MDPGSLVLASVALLLVANQALLMAPALQRPAVFWTLQALNLGLAVAMVVVGVPGYTDLPILGWMMALLLLLRLARNLRWLGERGREHRAETARRHRERALQQALERDPD